MPLSLRGWFRQGESAAEKELRQLKAALSDAGGVVRYLGGRGQPPKRGTRELLQAYSESPWIRAISKRVAESVAGVEWRVFRQTSRGSMAPGAAARRLSRIGDARKRAEVRSRLVKQAELEPVEAHPLLDFLDRGNGSTINGLEARTLAQIQLDLVGDGFAIKETNGRGEPAQWWPIPPHWVSEVPRPGQEYVFELQVPGGARSRVPGENMIWFCDRDPRDPYGLGTGVGRALADEIDTDEFVSKFVKNTFFNDARPGLLVTGEGLQKDQLDQLEEKWLQKVQGIFKARRPLFLNKKVEVHPIQRTFEELELTDLRKFERDICMEVWGVPPEILGIIENSNRSTIDAADYLFQRGVIVPRAEKMRAVLQAQIVPGYRDPSLVVDFESPVSEDKEHARSVYAQAPWAFTVDEHRALGCADTLADDKGRVFPSPLGLMSAEEPLGADSGFGDPGEDEDPPDPPEPEGDEEETEDPDDEKSAKAARAPIVKRELSEAEVQQILRTIAPSDMADDLLGPLRAALLSFGQAAIDDLGLQILFNESSPRVVEYLRHEAGSRIARINRTTQRQLRATLVRGTQEGDSFDQLAERIDGLFRSNRMARARTIARTESVRASNFGALEGMQQGGVERKSWLSSRDSRVRDAHAPGSGLDGVTIPIGAEFTDPVTGSKGMHPGDFPDPASSINCRCVLLSVMADDTAAATTPAAKDAHWKRHENRRAPVEGRLVRAARKGFERQRRRVRAALEAIPR